MLITTWNVNSLTVRLDQVLNYITAKNIDILCLQETKTTNEKFPVKAFTDLNYHCIYSGEKTYNGVAIISKDKLEFTSNSLTQYPQTESKRFLAANFNNKENKNTTIINVYIPNGQEIDSEKYIYKMEWLSQLQAYLNKNHNHDESIILLGDFNIAPGDLDVFDPNKTSDSIMTSTAERSMYEEILQWGFIDLFREQHKESSEFSWWDYRNFSFKRNLGYRIDLILGTKNIYKNLIDIYIDKEPRKNDRPSDHTPVTLEIE